MGIDVGMKKRNKEIAKVMKKEGESLEKISKYTGLSEMDIETL